MMRTHDGSMSTVSPTSEAQQWLQYDAGMDATTFLGMERLSESRWRLEVTERLITP